MLNQVQHDGVIHDSTRSDIVIQSFETMRESSPTIISGVMLNLIQHLWSLIPDTE